MPPVTNQQLRASVRTRSKPLSDFKVGKKQTSKIVTRRGQSSYSYTLTEPPGQNFHPDFTPEYTPGQMLQLGVFSGKYINDCTSEFPREWFVDALAADKLRPEQGDPGVNLFKVKSRKSLQYWEEKGWIPLIPTDPDTRGWFMWYCRYWIGRRIPGLDEMQVKRWKSFRRHAGQVAAANPPATRAEKRRHRPVQRQALLQWSHDPWV